MTSTTMVSSSTAPSADSGKTQHPPACRGLVTTAKQRRPNRHPSKPKMTKEERREKYTQIARQRQYKKRHQSTVCFCCRETGHTANDCPKQGGRTNSNHQQEMSGKRNKKKSDVKTPTTTSPTSSARICYKCGSTEHSLFACPKYSSSNKSSLPFATCFVCGEMGHLASQCDANTHGLYINGGQCRICGSKRHFEKECPEEKRKKKRKQKNDTDDEEEQQILEGLLEGERSTGAGSSGSTTLISKEQQEERKQKKKKRVVNF